MVGKTRPYDIGYGASLSKVRSVLQIVDRDAPYVNLVQDVRSHINVNPCSKSLKNLITSTEYIVQNTIFVSNC